MLLPALLVSAVSRCSLSLSPLRLMSAAPLTTSWGAPVDDNNNSLSIGSNGPLLLQDVALIDKLAHFDRERIPERVVHAKGGQTAADTQSTQSEALSKQIAESRNKHTDTAQGSNEDAVRVAFSRLISFLFANHPQK